MSYLAILNAIYGFRIFQFKTLLFCQTAARIHLSQENLSQYYFAAYLWSILDLVRRASSRFSTKVTAYIARK